MARAPTPGAGNRPGPAARFRIRVRDQTFELTTNVTLKEKIAVRLATGLPFEAFYAGENRVGEDSVCVLWWLARRQNGQPGLPWAQHEAEWPSPLVEGDIDLEVLDDDDGEATDNPES